MDRKYLLSPDDGKHWFHVGNAALFDLIRPRYIDPEEVLKQIDAGETISISKRAKVRVDERQ